MVAARSPLVLSLALAACASPPRPPPRSVAPPPVVAIVVAPPPPAPAEPPLPPPYAPPALPVEQLQPVRAIDLPATARRDGARVIALDDGFALSATGWLARYDGAGTRRWRRTYRPIGREWYGAGALRVRDALVQQERDAVAAYDASTGALRWRRALPRPAESVAHFADADGISMPPALWHAASDGATLMLRVSWSQCNGFDGRCDDPSAVEQVLALAWRDGATRWQQAALEQDRDVNSGPIAASNLALFIPARGAIGATVPDGVALFDFATGAERWRHLMAGPPRLVLGDDSDDGLRVEREVDVSDDQPVTVALLDYATGAERALPASPGRPPHWLRVDDGVGFTLRERDGRASVDAIDLATGAVRARTPLAETPNGWLAVDGDAFVGNGVAFDRRDGRVRWRWPGVWLTPVDGGRRYVGLTDSHRAFIFERSPRPVPPEEEVTLEGRLEDWPPTDERPNDWPVTEEHPNPWEWTDPPGIVIAPDGTFRVTLRARGELWVRAHRAWNSALVVLRGLGHYRGVLPRRTSEAVLREEPERW